MQTTFVGMCPWMRNWSTQENFYEWIFLPYFFFFYSKKELFDDDDDHIKKGQIKCMRRDTDINKHQPPFYGILYDQERFLFFCKKGTWESGVFS